jgi:parallel beta-helix repeat protein
MDKLVTILAALVLAVPCAAKVITVDGDGAADHQSIQAAIDKSWHGDTIVVRPGTYRERVTFNGRRITVRSEDPGNPLVVQATVIAGSGDASVVFEFAEGPESVLTGFTITGAGILCNGASPTIRGNVIRNCTGVGIRGRNNARPTILNNQILANRLEGIYACDGLIQGNIISGNGAGLGFCNGSILDNVIVGNSDAGGLYSCNGTIAGNTISGNYASTDGGGLYNCAGEIRNNVITGNRALRRGGGLHQCPKAVRNNTIVGNQAGVSGGGISQSPGLVYNNIIAFNEAPAGGGLHGQSANTYNAFWANVGGHLGGGAIAGLGDLVVDPLFAANGYWDDKGNANPADDVWVDGDYHLRSQAGRWDAQDRRWVVDPDTSLCIDAGKPDADWSAELWPHGKRINLGAYGGTLQASLSLSGVGLPTDLDHDERVGPRDLMWFSHDWLTGQAPAAGDFNRQGTVDFADFAILAMDWRTGSSAPTPPAPDPMTFARPPFPTGPYSMAMVATTATSTDGTGVEYYFEDFFHPGFNSGWRSYGPNEEPRWEDTDLTPNTLYWYRVKARNRGNRLETQWSDRLSDFTLLEDFTPPAPNPMTWETQPHSVASGTIRMVATTAVDDSSVEYQFECTSHPALSSAWQSSSAYEVTGVAKGYYTFRVRARDKSPNQNMTLWSVEAAVDLLPPSPDPMKWASEPREVRIGSGTFDYHARMTAVEATDDSPEVEYFFQCTTESAFSSGWQTSREYTVKVGRSGQRQRFRVKARDASPSRNETAWSTELPAM